MALRSRLMHSSYNNSAPSVRQMLEYTGSLPPVEQIEFRSHRLGDKPASFVELGAAHDFLLQPRTHLYEKITVQFRGSPRRYPASLERIHEKTMMIVMDHVVLSARPEAIAV